MDNIEIYLKGRALYGDDFDMTQILHWYTEEQEGYTALCGKDVASYKYGYHALNKFHGYRHLPSTYFGHVLGFGGACGDELLPIISKVSALTIVDPSSALARNTVYGTPAKYIKPVANGKLPFSDNTFDLITCFGVLHHIPNVSIVTGELSRVLKPKSFMLLREPIVSMGDWRQPRHGLTKRERGIPLQILLNIVQKSSLQIVRQSLCVFPLTARLFRAIRSDVYNSAFATWVDAKLSAAFAWNVNYHPHNTLQRLRPTSAFLILRKRTLQDAAPLEGEDCGAKTIRSKIKEQVQCIDLQATESSRRTI